MPDIPVQIYLTKMAVLSQKVFRKGTGLTLLSWQRPSDGRDFPHSLIGNILNPLPAINTLLLSRD